MLTLATNVEADAGRIIVAGVLLILAIIILSLTAHQQPVLM